VKEFISIRSAATIVGCLLSWAAPRADQFANHSPVGLDARALLALALEHRLASRFFPELRRWDPQLVVPKTVGDVRRVIQQTEAEKGTTGGTTPKPAIGAFGLDLTARDPSVKPGDDFFHYAEGHWLATAQLPPDRTRWGTFDALSEKSESDVHEVLEELMQGNGAPGSIERKVGDFYASFLDTLTIDSLGLAPARPGVAAIAAAKTYQDIARLMARPDLQLPTPIDFQITVDDKNPDRYVVGIRHGGLGLPEREYYLKSEEPFTTLRAKYAEHIVRLLSLAGHPNATNGSQQILDLETEIAKRHWPIAQRRERDLTYNPKTRAELKALAPQFPWDPSLAAAGLAGQQEFIVRELDAIGPLAKLFRATPVSTWKIYLTYHYLRSHATVLPTAFDEEVFAFFGHTLGGQPEQRARWKRAVGATNGALGEAIGQIYVQRSFPPSSKAQVRDMIENLRSTYAEHIRNASWMSEETKTAALEKLRLFRAKVGYPDTWRDYTALEVKRGDAFGNAVRSAVFEWQRQVKRLDQPTDREEWDMTPQTVNAYYNAKFNEIVFPAAILQPPFFDPAADPAVNYGGIGGIIGHEMGHGFDDQGAKSDGRGVLRTWWTERDAVAFAQRVDRLADQYSEFEPLPGLHLNGRLTLGENIGDLNGCSVALEAYRFSLRGRPVPVIDGISGEQRFFFSWAQVWRAIQRDEALRNQVMTNPHSPVMYRVNGVMRNVDAWYDAFNIQPGDKLYVAADKRVRIW
jgi:putative endopeptidase